MKNKMFLPALRGVIGDWVYYSSLMNASQVVEYIKTVKDIREAKFLDDYLQRDLKDRKFEISKYLQNSETRFFNSLVIGVFGGVPDWIELNFKTNSIGEHRIDNIDYLKESIGFLVFNGDEQMFAIDGQHRVAGIQIAYGENKDSIIEDQFSVLFIAHIDDEQGKKRSRKLFSDINKNAKAVAQGDRIIIDEDDICAVVTRRLFQNYDNFKDKDIIALTENANLEKNDDKHFTNLLCMYGICKDLKKSLFRKQPKTNDMDEVNIKKLYSINEAFYNTVFENIVCFKEYFSGTKNLKTFRDKNNLLFRPIGLSIVAKVYSILAKQKQIGIFNTYINKLSFNMPDSPFNDIIWDSGKISLKGKTIAVSLSLYLFGLITDKTEIDNLRDKISKITKKYEKYVLPPRLSK